MLNYGLVSETGSGQCDPDDDDDDVKKKYIDNKLIFKRKIYIYIWADVSWPKAKLPLIQQVPPLKQAKKKVVSSCSHNLLCQSTKKKFQGDKNILYMYMNLYLD